MSDFGLRIGVEGERDFKAALRDINQAFKVLGSEMQLVTSQFDKNERSIGSLTSRNAVLTKEIDQQRDKVSTLRSALDNAAASFGESDKRTQNWQIQLNKAQAELNHMERELKGNNAALAAFGKETRAAGDAQGDVSAGTKRTSASFSELGGLLRDNVTQSVKEVRTGMAETGRQVVESAKDMGSSIVQFGKDTLSGENNVKALGNALRDKLEAALTGSAKETERLGESLDGTGGELEDTGKKTKRLGDELENTGKTADDAGGKFDKLGSVVKGVGVAIGASMAAIGGAAIGAGKAIWDMAADTAKVANQVDKMSQKMGLSRQEYQEWGYIMEQNGLSIDKFSSGMKYLQLRMVDLQNDNENTQKKFRQLGLEFDAVARASPNEAMEMTVRAFQNMPEGAEKTALAFRIFGRQSLELMPLLNQTAESTDHLREMAHKLGIVMSDDMVDAGVKLSDNITEMKASFTGLKNQLGAQMLPGLASVTSGITGLVLGSEDAGRKITVGMREVVNGISSVIPRMIEVVGTIAATLGAIAPDIITALVNGIVSNIPLLTSAALDIVLSLVSGIITALPLLLEGAIQIINELAVGIAQALPELIPAIVSVVMQIVQTLIDNMPMLLDAALQLILGLTEGLLAALPELIAAMPAIIVGLVNFLIESIPQIIDAGILLLTAIIGALPEIITAIVEALPLIIEGIVGGLIGALPELIGAGWQLLKGLLTGILNAVPELLRGVRDVAMSLIRAVLGVFGINSPSTVFANIGRNLLRGLWEGILNMRDWLINQIRGLGNLITGALKSVLGISSPSRVFRDQIGANLAFGLGEGFTTAMRRVTRDMQNAVPSDFDMDAKLSTNIGRRGSGQQSGMGSVILNLTIETFNNNTAQDIRQLTEEISTLLADGIRRKGAATA